MLFWILVGVTVGVPIVIVVHASMTDRYFEFRDGFLVWILATFISATASALLLLLLLITIPSNITIESEKYELRALAVSDTVKGSFFLGSGTIGGKRVLNYIVTDDEGFMELQSVPTSASRIAEGDWVPSVTVNQHYKSNPWLYPWGGVGAGQTYDFRIPSGSVLEDFTIDNG